MITYEEAKSRVHAHAEPLGPTTVPVESSRGFALFDTVCAPFDVPLFDNSAVDGYGVKVQDICTATDQQPSRLKLVGEIRAGDIGDVSIESGSAVRILTGAPVPTSVEAVVMKEYVALEGPWLLVYRPCSPGMHIRRKGEEYLQGQAVLQSGSRITPALVGVLGSFGMNEVRVFRMPRVTVLSTGSELTRPGLELPPGKIYESTSYAVASALGALGMTGVQRRYVDDEPQHLHEALAKALSESDVVITLGGVSVGEYDFVKSALHQLNVREVYWKVAIKPGKPNYFGVSSSSPARLIFGLPGNPVSSLVSYYVLVRPALLRLMGHRSLESFTAQAVLTCALHKQPGRLEFVRGVFTRTGSELQVTPTPGQGSHMQGGLAAANCLIRVPLEAQALKAGARVTIELLQW